MAHLGTGFVIGAAAVVGIAEALVVRAGSPLLPFRAGDALPRQWSTAHGGLTLGVYLTAETCLDCTSIGGELRRLASVASAPQMVLAMVPSGADETVARQFLKRERLRATIVALPAHELRARFAGLAPPVLFVAVRDTLRLVAWCCYIPDQT